MSIYFKPGKGWRYDFTLKGERYTEAWFKTKAEAKRADAKRREEVLNPQVEPERVGEETPTGMGFLNLVNLWLDFLYDHRSPRYYYDAKIRAGRWVSRWKGVAADELTSDEIEAFVKLRGRISAHTANVEIRMLRSLYNWGLDRTRGFTSNNPAKGVAFYPTGEKKRNQHIPSVSELDALISVASPDDQDYLWVIRETMGRVSEINRMTWKDVDFESGYVVLKTRKKKGGNLTPRKVFMTRKLREVLERRHSGRKKSLPWLFWHRYWSRKQNKWVVGPFQDRKRLMQTVCREAGVPYFRYHPIRHASATAMAQCNVPIESIQRILGHENRSTTEIYIHSSQESEREAMRRYEAYRENSHTDSHTAGVDCEQ